MWLKPSEAPSGAEETLLDGIWPPPDGPASDQDLAEISAAIQPLVPLAARFSTQTELSDWLDRLKRVEEIREKRLKNEETEGTLIPRELVKTHVFGAIEMVNRRLLTDSPKTIARRLYALAKSGAPIEEAEEVVREIISSQLRPMKDKTVRVLRNA